MLGPNLNRRYIAINFYSELQVLENKDQHNVEDSFLWNSKPHPQWRVPTASTSFFPKTWTRFTTANLGKGKPLVVMATPAHQLRLAILPSTSSSRQVKRVPISWGGARMTGTIRWPGRSKRGHSLLRLFVIGVPFHDYLCLPFNRTSADREPKAVRIIGTNHEIQVF